MKIFGIIGWQNSGKTTLTERLLAELLSRGYTVSTVKHVHHDVDLDKPGKDTWRHREAGASEVVMVSAKRFALMREHRGPEPALAEILARLAPVDLVLVEGYKRDSHRRLEVWREGVADRPMIALDDPLVAAVASDKPVPGLAVPLFDLNDVSAIASFILRDLGLAEQGRAG